MLVLYAHAPVFSTTVYSQSDSCGAAADELILEFVGKASTCVKYTTERTIEDRYGNRRTVRDKHMITDSNEFVAIHTHLAAFGGTVDAGKHSFPFAVTLPATLPSTMKVVKA